MLMGEKDVSSDILWGVYVFVGFFGIKFSFSIVGDEILIDGDFIYILMLVCIEEVLCI